MVSIRYQLEDLRIVCDLVKRREKNKQKLVKCLSDVFRAKVKLLAPDFQCNPTENPSNNHSTSNINAMSL